MELNILYDNQTPIGNFQSDWGFSCLINDTVLFDTGAHWDILKHNAELAGVNFSNLSEVVISHDHWDHTGGLWDLLDSTPGLKVYGCPGFSDGFKKAIHKAPAFYFELAQYSKISNRIFSTGEMAGIYKGKNLPEQSIVFKNENGIGIITGCAHPGIFRIIEQVQKTFDNGPIAFLFGGFHLTDKVENEIETLAKTLKSMGVQKIGSCHCSGIPTQKILKKVYGSNYFPMGAGTTLEIP